MPSCLYFSVDIEKWGILLEADSSHPLAFDVEKNPYKNKTKSDTRQMLFLGHEIVFAIYCVGCCSEDIATSQDVPEKKKTLLDVSLIFSVMILLFYEY